MTRAPTPLNLRLEKVLTSLRPADSRLTLGAGLLLLLIVIGFTFRDLVGREAEYSWLHLLVALILLAPLSVLLSGAEYSATARLVGARLRLSDAISVAAISSAANLLPIPGSYLYRVRALRLTGTKAANAAGAPLTVAAIWVGIALLLLGVRMFAENPRLFSVGIALAGLGCLLTGTLVARRIADDSLLAVLPIIGIETAMILLSVARFHLTLLGLGYSPTITQSLGLAVSSVLGTAIGLFPAGLGIKEMLAALVSPLVGLDAAIAVLATVVNRIIGLLAVAFVAALLLRRDRRQPLSDSTHHGS